MTLYNRIFIFFIMMFAPIISSFANAEIKFSAEDSQAISLLLEKIEPNKPTMIDLTQPENEKGHIALLRYHGITKQTHPEIFEDIEAMKANPNAMIEHGKSVETGNLPTEPTNHFGNPRIIFSKDSKLISAEVFSSAYFPDFNPLINNVTKIDPQNAKIDGFLSVLKENKSGKKDSMLVHKNKVANNKEVRDFSIQTEEYNLTDLKQLNAVQTVVYFRGKINGQSIAPTGAVYVVSDKLKLTNFDDLLQNYQPYKMDNAAPVYVKNLHKLDQIRPVIVCLNRANPEPGAMSHCDYGPTSPGNPTIKLKIAGSVTFHNRIAIDDEGKPTEAQGYKPSVDLTLVGLDTGGACKLSRDINENTFWEHTTVNDGSAKGNDTNLSWDFSEKTGYADFGPICWKNNERYILDLQATIMTTQGEGEGGQVFPVMFSYTNNPRSKEDTAQFIYPPIQIQYGCIAEGTLIDMADGLKRKVENIRPGDKVLTKQGGVLQVKSRIVGHDTEFVDLIYNNGEQVSLTPTHPVSTLRGIVKADELKIGDTIHTRDGQTTLTSVKQRKSEPSNVYNFVLEKTDSQSELLPEDAVLFAGGILVGDNNLQRKVSISN